MYIYMYVYICIYTHTYTWGSILTEPKNLLNSSLVKADPDTGLRRIGVALERLDSRSSQSSTFEEKPRGSF